MNNLDIMADSLFLPLSLHASLSDIKSRAIPNSSEVMLLMLGILMILLRAFILGFQDPLQTMINNALPLLLLCIFSILGKSGIGDLEYATSMALFYPSLLKASTFSIFPFIFKKITISASTVSIALMNAILLACLSILFRDILRWFKEHNFSKIGAYIAAITAPLLFPIAMILEPFLINRRTQYTIDVPFIPFMFIGFLVVRYANAILL